MNAIEADFEPLAGQLPKDYDRFENKLLEDLLRIFDSEACAPPPATCSAASTNTS